MKNVNALFFGIFFFVASLGAVADDGFFDEEDYSSTQAKEEPSSNKKENGWISSARKLADSPLGFLWGDLEGNIENYDKARSYIDEYNKLYGTNF